MYLTFISDTTLKMYLRDAKTNFQWSRMVTLSNQAGADFETPYKKLAKT